MERKVVDCDVQNCKFSNASGFSFFKERRQDGAGSMENWYYTFDLCPQHQAELLTVLLNLIEKKDSDLLLTTVNKMFKITMREA